MNAPLVDGAVVERVEEHFAAGIHHCHPHPEGYGVGGHRLVLMSREHETLQGGEGVGEKKGERTDKQTHD